MIVHHLSLRHRAAALDLVGRSLAKTAAKAPPFSLAFLTDLSRVSEPLIVARVLPEASALIMRDYHAPRRAAMAKQFASICRARGVTLLIGNNPDLALAVGADGVHWPSWQTNRIKPAGMIASAACHNAAELASAADGGADVALLSPVFQTPSHPGADAMTRGQFATLAQQSPIPVLALGGISLDNVNQVHKTGAAGIAVIGALSPSRSV